MLAHINHLDPPLHHRLKLIIIIRSKFMDIFLSSACSGGTTRVPRFSNYSLLNWEYLCRASSRGGTTRSRHSRAWTMECQLTCSKDTDDGRGHNHEDHTQNSIVHACDIVVLPLCLSCEQGAPPFFPAFLVISEPYLSVLLLPTKYLAYFWLCRTSIKSVRPQGKGVYGS